MDNLDTLFPFTSDEINLFSRLHLKATKFPAPPSIKVRSIENVDVGEKQKQIDDENAFCYEDDADKQ